MTLWHWKKSLTAGAVGLALAWLAGTWLPAAAQEDAPVGAAALAADAQAGAVVPPLGQPGLSFRYVQTYGETEVAYISDVAHLNYPWGIGADGNGIWIGERWGNRVLKYDSNGHVQTQFGRARFPDSNEDTSFWEIVDVTAGSGGNFWVVDEATNRVVELTASGEKLRELGKMWEEGADNDHFVDPAGVALDAAGNIYVSDGAPWWNQEHGNHRIQVFRSDGSYLSTIGQTGVCGSGSNQFCGPRHIAIYGNELYVTDSGNNRVQVYNISTPTVPSYVATIGNLSNPSGVTVDSDFIYVADRWNHQVKVYNRISRTLTATIGSGKGSGNDQFTEPSDVAVDAAGNLYVADFANTRVQQFHRSGGTWLFVRTYGVTGVPYVTDGYHFNTVSGVAVAGNGDIYLTEDYGQRLVKLNANGVPLWTVGAAGVKGDWDDRNDRLNNPADVALDVVGKAYVASRWHQRVQIYNPNGSFFASIGSLNCPGGVTVAPNGNLYVADSCDHSVGVYNAALTKVATLGIPGESGTDNLHFNSPEDVAVDSDGTTYVSDLENHRVQVFDANRNYVRTIGQSGVRGVDFAHLDRPTGLTVDSAKRLYVADDNNRIQVFDVNGAYLTTIGGSWGSRTGQLRAAMGVAVDQTGNVYVADYNNHRVQKFAPGTPNWRQVNINGFGNPQQYPGALASFGGKLASGTYNFDGGANLWQLNGGWTQAATGGLGDPTNVGILRLFEFGGQLYAGVDNWDQAANRSAGAQLLRSANGTAWTPVMTGGFGRIDNGGIFAIDAFSGTLYAGTYSYTSTHGAELWRSATGNPGEWQQVAPNGFGTANNRGIWSLATYNGHFYAGTRNTQSGPEIWRSPDGLNWNKIATGGFGASSLTMVYALEPFNGYLYAGVHSNPSVNTTDAILWRCQTCDGSDWQAVTPLRFGSSNNRAVESLIVYNRMLYAFTVNAITGMEVWRTSDGASWAQVGFAGMGDANNAYPLYDNATVIHNGNLYVGVWNNYNGGKIWQYIPDRATVDIADPAQAHTLTFTPATGGQSTVQIPANALDQPTELVYEPFTPSTQPAGFAFAGRAFELNAYRANALVENLNFLQPVTVILDYTDAEVAGQDETKLELRRWDIATSTWVDAACGAYDRQPAQNRLSVPVCHLSQFGLFGPMEYLYLPAVRR